MDRSWITAIILLIIQLFLLFPLPLSADSAELLQPVPTDGICRSLDIRNDVSNFKELENCHVIEGSLQILLIDTNNQTELMSLSFPNLTEITDYLLLFRFTGLKSIGQLFPNLAVIRGQHLLFGDKALIIFEMASLQEIGLYSLTKIMNGKVAIDRNPSLCFTRSIDWSKIINGEDTNFIKSFKPENECPICPASINGKSCPVSDKDNTKYLCWNTDHCQNLCPGCGKRACNSMGQCCHTRCAGGCADNDTSKCKSCEGFILSIEDHSSKCVQKCPHNYLSYLQRRCVSNMECRKMERPIEYEEIDVQQPYKIHEDACILECPPNYSGNYSDHSCMKCNNTCRKECSGARIDSINLARQLRGCTHIMGTVEIQIRGGNQVVKALEENLGMIEEIDGYLKIVRSFSLVSLNFLKNLKRIRGRTLESQRYSLIVLDNQNLQDLFDWDQHKEFKIDNGKLFFHFNPKLCIEKIDELLNKSSLPVEYTDIEVARNSNGDKVACKIIKLDVNISEISTNEITLSWHPFDIEDSRKLLSYVVYSIEAPTMNVNFFDGKDACGPDNWNVDDVANNLESDPITHRIKNLKPYTQYAFFIKTYTIATETRGAQSDIRYFMTKPAQPSEPLKVRVTSYSSDSLKVNWLPPKRPHGEIQCYIIRGEKVNSHFSQDRNYCTDSIIPEVPKITSTVPPKTTSDDCKNIDIQNELKGKDEQEEQARIDFENALHNKVYIKKTGRRRRSMDAEYIDRDTNNATLNASSSNFKACRSFQNANNTVELIDNNREPNSSYFQYFAFQVDASIRTLVVENLRHFTTYQVRVMACRKEDEADSVSESKCGELAYFTETTIAKPGADRVTNVSIVNTTSSSVTVRWNTPPNPNRRIVAYTIYHKREDTKNTQPTKECISFQEFRNFSSDGKYLIHTIPKLYSGNHSLFIKASSLYGIGEESEIVVFYIPESGPNIVLIGCLIFFFIIILIFCAGFIYYKRLLKITGHSLFPDVNPEYMSSVYVIDEWEIPRRNLEFIKELGQGSFGMVWEGIGTDFKDVNGSMRCAIKTVNEHATAKERVDFLNEASVMKAFNTTHVVKLLGVVSQGQPAYVAMELMVNGDLKTYLRSCRPDNLDGRVSPTLSQIMQMAIEIADGMAYLESKKFVHRDLAARNCMVAEDLTVKIGDFGMTRDIYETDYYRKGSRGLLPVRWMSPESLKDGVFSSSSDCWSYGIVLWEMATFASQPYQGLSNEQVLRYIMEGGMMERPENCPDTIYNVMQQCWDLRPGRRPTFMRLVEILLPIAHDRFRIVSFYHSDEGSESRAIRAAAAAPFVRATGGEDTDDADASTPLNPLPSDLCMMGGPFVRAPVIGCDSVRDDPAPRFYSMSMSNSEHQQHQHPQGRAANGYAGGGDGAVGRPRNGKAQSQL